MLFYILPQVSACCIGFGFVAIIWMIFYWYFSYKYVLEPVESNELLNNK